MSVIKNVRSIQAKFRWLNRVIQELNNVLLKYIQHFDILYSVIENWDHILWSYFKLYRSVAQK